MGNIKVSNLGKAYKQYPNNWIRLMEWLDPLQRSRHQLKWILKDINFIIQPGESVAIMGINGAGKSTLLKIISGTTRATTGSVKISGRVAALLELGMGFHPDFTGRQNAYLSCQLLGYKADEIKQLIPEIENFAEIGEYFDQSVRIYSSGMQVRLAFSVATAARPDILIVDEALSVGDAFFQAKCYNRINEYKNKGTTLLLVTHSPSDVVKHCDRAILIDKGEIEIDGTTRDVTNFYLNKLFGNEKNIIEKKDSTENHQKNIKNNKIESFMIENNDLYHTRVGYRKEEYRWGQGGARIIDYLIISKNNKYPTAIEGNNITEFYFKVIFDRDFENIVPGFLIKTLEGIFLYGTNSFDCTHSGTFIKANKNDLKIFCFSMPLSLTEGHYLISFGISTGNPLTELIPLDRRYDSVMVNIVKSVNFWGIVDLNANFKSIELNKELTT